jgi:hypothetical protein
MRPWDNTLPHGIHPDVPSDRFRGIAAAKDMIVEATLPKSLWEFVAKEVSGLLLPLPYKFSQV